MDPTLDPYLFALGQIESGNNYGAVGPATKSGDRAYGRYQVMGSNIPTWTKMVTGTAMTPEEYLNDPSAQDAVARHYFGSAMQKYGNPYDAASVWFSGKPMAQAGNASDGYNTVPQYVSKFKQALASQDPMAAALSSPNAMSFGGGRAGLAAETPMPMLAAMGFGGSAPQQQPQAQQQQQVNPTNMGDFQGPSPASLVAGDFNAADPQMQAQAQVGLATNPKQVSLSPQAGSPTNIVPPGANSPAAAPNAAQSPTAMMKNMIASRMMLQQMMGGKLGAVTNGLQGAGAWLESINNPIGGAMMNNSTQSSLMNALKMRSMFLPQFGQVGSDIMGHPIMGYHNPFTMRTYDINGNLIGGPGGGAGGQANANAPLTPATLTQIQSAVASGIAPEAALAKYAPAYANLAISYAQGREFPQDLSRQTMTGVQELARAAYPNVTDAMIANRQKFAQAYANTAPNAVGGQIAAANRVIDHTNDALGYLNTLDKSGIFTNGGAVLGGVGNKISFQSAIANGNTQVQEAESGLRRTLVGLATETQRAQGKQPTQTETEELVNSMDPAVVGPAASREAIGANMKMLYGTADGIAATRNLGYTAQKSDSEDAWHDPLLYQGKIRTSDLFGPAQRKALQKWGVKRDASEDEINDLFAAPKASSGNGIPKPGNYKFDPSTGKLVPMQ